jgi:hypothetical protein
MRCARDYVEGREVDGHEQGQPPARTTPDHRARPVRRFHSHDNLTASTTIPQCRSRPFAGFPDPLVTFMLPARTTNRPGNQDPGASRSPLARCPQLLTSTDLCSRQAARGPCGGAAGPGCVSGRCGWRVRAGPGRGPGRRPRPGGGRRTKETARLASIIGTTPPRRQRPPVSLPRPSLTPGLALHRISRSSPPGVRPALVD